MKKQSGSLVMLVGVLCAFLLIAYNIYVFLFVNIKTEIVTEGKIESVINADGISVRDETVLLDEEGGIINNYVSEGERVSKGTKIAAYYDAEVDADKQAKLKNLNERMLNLERLRDERLSASETKINADSEVSELIPTVIESLHNGDGTQMSDVELKLAEMIDERISSSSRDVNALISDLKSEKQEIENTISGDKKDIYAPQGGVYYQSKDGYENVFSFDSVTELSLSDFNKIPVDNNSKKENGVIKLVNNYEWKFAVPISEKKVSGLKTGSVIKLRFKDFDNQIYKTDVVSISQPKNGKVLLVLRGYDNCTPVFTTRKLNADIIFNSEQGLKFNKDAVKVINGESGVYIVKKSVVRFRKIDILASDDKYVVVRETNSIDYPNLLLYDEVVVSGDAKENAIIK